VGSSYSSCALRGWLLPLAEDAGGGCGALASHVTKLHCTPWRAQFEHGFSSSHCPPSVQTHVSHGKACRSNVLLHAALYTVYNPTSIYIQCQGLYVIDDGFREINKPWCDLVRRRRLAKHGSWFQFNLLFVAQTWHRVLQIRRQIGLRMHGFLAGLPSRRARRWCCRSLAKSEKANASVASEAAVICGPRQSLRAWVEMRYALPVEDICRLRGPVLVER
jgi:hypothetical protein